MRERGYPSECLQTKFTWPQLKVSPRCLLPFAELSACVCARVATLFIEPTRFMRVAIATIISSSTISNVNRLKRHLCVARAALGGTSVPEQSCSPYRASMVFQRYERARTWYLRFNKIRYIYCPVCTGFLLLRECSLHSV